MMMMMMIYLIDRVKAEKRRMNLFFTCSTANKTQTTTKGKVTINHRENSQDTNHIKDNIC